MLDGRRGSGDGVEICEEREKVGREGATGKRLCGS